MFLWSLRHISIFILPLPSLFPRSVPHPPASHSWILEFLKIFFPGYICLCIFPPGELIHYQFQKSSTLILTTPDLYLEFQAIHSTSALGFSHKHLKWNMVKAALKPSHVNLLLILYSTTWYSVHSLSRNRHNGAWLTALELLVYWMPIYSNCRKMKGNSLNSQ